MRYRKSFFFFNDTATTEIYTLSLHDALPISPFTPAKDDGSLNVEYLFTEKGNDQEPQTLPPLDFELPPELEASEPPEARGLMRDEVRLMVTCASDDRVVHSRFRDLEDFLEAGDVLVVNTSGTMNAALERSEERRVGKECRSRWSPYH